jgi:hypothetical protein
MSTRQSQSSPTTITAWPPESEFPFKGRGDELDESPQASTNMSVFRLSRYITFESRSWRLALGIVALIDCAMTVWLYCFRDYFANSVAAPKRIFFRNSQNPSLEHSALFGMVRQCTEELHKWHAHSGVLFAFLWFIDAFLKAQWKRDEKLTELDRRRVMKGEVTAECHDLVGEAWIAYYKTIGLQLLLLPVGFYVFGWYTLTGKKQHVKALLMDGLGKSHSERSFKAIEATHSLIYSFIHSYTILINQVLGEKVEMRRKLLWRRLIVFAIRRPFLFTKRLRIFFSTLRLTKYLGPLMGETAKFFGNTSDLLKTWRQHLAVMKACRLRKKRWDGMDPVEQQHAAAIRIQCAVRGMLTRKTVKAFMAVLKARKERIARRLQKAVRASLVVSRTQHDLMRLELDKLEEEAKAAKQRGCAISIDHRRRMYQLQDELEQRAKELVNKHMLLRPNARFALVWKVMFIFCVLLDIAQQALQPRLRDYKDATTGETISVEQFLELHVVPKPIREWQQCAPWFAEQSEKSGFFNRRPHRVILEEPPWYCQERYVAAQSIWITVLRFCVMQAALFVGIMRYLDVGVTFFIGELHPQTGTLVAKSFVKRWIFPGLLLELLANPQMETTSKFVGRFLEGVVQIGPFRVGRWTLVGLYPLAKVVKRTVIQLWRSVVLQQNRECMERDAEKAHRTSSMSRSRSAHAMSSMKHVRSALMVPGLRRSNSSLLVAATRSSFALHELDYSYDD